jgi:hypothetical protein
MERNAFEGKEGGKKGHCSSRPEYMHCLGVSQIGKLVVSLLCCKSNTGRLKRNRRWKYLVSTVKATTTLKVYIGFILH